jgi:hypothetical protein
LSHRIGGKDAVVISEAYVKNLVLKNERQIIKLIKKKKYDDVLSLISICASILYTTNICFTDDLLEKSVERVAMELKINDFKSITDYNANDDTVLFYDGFGFNSRGLAQIYLRALCKVKKVVYITFEDRKEIITEVQDILDEYGSERRYLKRRGVKFTNQVKQLNEIIKEFRPGHMFFYAMPDDVVATPILYAYEGMVIRYQINLTDHAFWLGAQCLDKCIEFRDYGASISKEYRNVHESKLVVVPFYPILHREKEFKGYPFNIKEGQKVVFSGGSLYKTLGAENQYYQMVDHLLECNKEVIFWYAGSGDDSHMRKIIAKYPERAYLTNERSDLFQVLEHCCFYLSTYPMIGGLMYQYAAMAGCVPLTLKNEIMVSDGFLLNQESINIEFYNVEDLYDEADRLINDEVYRYNRSILMKKSVISPESFESEISKLISGEKKLDFKVSYNHIDTDKMRKWYLSELTKADVDVLFVKRNTLIYGMQHYPLRIIRGGMHIAKEIVVKLL